MIVFDKCLIMIMFTRGLIRNLGYMFISKKSSNKKEANTNNKGY